MYIYKVIIFLLLNAFGHSSQICSVSSSERPLINTLVQMLLQRVEDDSVDSDPAAFIALRLARQHNLRAEQSFRERLKATAIRKVTQAFRSSCLNPASISDGQNHIDLVKLLEDKLNKKIQSLESKGHPLTDTYQISLGVLALCIEKQQVSDSIVQNITDRAKRRQDPFGEPLSVDRASMSILALNCLHRSNLSIIPKHHIEQAIMRLLLGILAEQQQDGTIGTIYSTALAVQALFENKQEEFHVFQCSHNLQRLISEIPKGTFNTVQKVFPLIPTLEGRSLLHVGDLTCTSDQDNLPQSK
ncbi:cobalamin binding intrinsic factor-like isoform X2 [Narcine bancroftii]|uniref:cobalamin binding intrinsic factor-like isoform X2 n=1 Tax=Narcine bancroftii TaxID=1343680 RepID=UPI003831FEC0